MKRVNLGPINTRTLKTFAILIPLFTLSLLLQACGGAASEDISVGNPAPSFSLPASDGSEVALSNYIGDRPALLYFHMAMGWPPCMQQIVDLENDPDFQSLDVALVSIAFDSPQELAQGKIEYGIQEVPLLTDTDQQVSEDYDVLQWAVGTGEPGHTFILVRADGTIGWIRDYGAPENGGVMYVPPNEISTQVRANLQ